MVEGGVVMAAGPLPGGGQPLQPAEVAVAGVVMPGTFVGVDAERIFEEPGWGVPRRMNGCECGQQRRYEPHKDKGSLTASSRSGAAFVAYMRVSPPGPAQPKARRRRF